MGKCFLITRFKSLNSWTQFSLLFFPFFFLYYIMLIELFNATPETDYYFVFSVSLFRFLRLSRRLLSRGNLLRYETKQQAICSIAQLPLRRGIRRRYAKRHRALTLRWWWAFPRALVTLSARVYFSCFFFYPGRVLSVCKDLGPFLTPFFSSSSSFFIILWCITRRHEVLKEGIPRCD